MADRQDVIPWAQPGWFEQAHLWIHAELDAQRIQVSGPIEQPHAYPWSTVLRMPTTQGTIYFIDTCLSL